MAKPGHEKPEPIRVPFQFYVNEEQEKTIREAVSLRGATLAAYLRGAALSRASADLARAARTQKSNGHVVA